MGMVFLQKNKKYLHTKSNNKVIKKIYKLHNFLLKWKNHPKTIIGNRILYKILFFALIVWLVASSDLNNLWENDVIIVILAMEIIFLTIILILATFVLTVISGVLINFILIPPVLGILILLKNKKRTFQRIVNYRNANSNK